LADQFIKEYRVMAMRLPCNFIQQQMELGGASGIAVASQLSAVCAPITLSWRASVFPSLTTHFDKKRIPAPIAFYGRVGLGSAILLY
jgi:hypothetical protein